MKNERELIKLFRAFLSRRGFNNVESSVILDVINLVNPTGELTEEEKQQVKELLLENVQAVETQQQTVAMVKAEAATQNISLDNQQVTDIAYLAQEQSGFEMNQIEAVKTAMIEYLDRSFNQRNQLLNQAMEEVAEHENMLLNQFQNNLGGTLNTFFRNRNQTHQNFIGGVLSSLDAYKQP